MEVPVNDLGGVPGTKRGRQDVQHIHDDAILKEVSHSDISLKLDVQQHHHPIENATDNTIANVVNESVLSESATESTANSNSKENSSEAVSKNQQKKRRRLEKLKVISQRRKEQDKQARYAKALAQGRNLDEERRLAAERAATGEGRKRRQEAWEIERIPMARKSFRVCLDCAFESALTSKEIASLALQIRHCYSANRNSSHPCFFAVTSLNGETLAAMKTVIGFDDWHLRAFDHTTLSFEQYYGESALRNIIYLTSDSEQVLTELNDQHVYVIGGIVDRNRLKGTTFERANQLGVKTAKLPLGEYLNKMAVKRVLTCNHVLQILLEYRKCGGDWGKAFASVLPKRKFAASPTPAK
jgi:tRNA (guanine9-N1)-methyltransferase